MVPRSAFGVLTLGSGSARGVAVGAATRVGVGVGVVKTFRDYENGHRIDATGTAHLADGDARFAYEKFDTAPPQPSIVLQALFGRCGTCAR